MQHLPWPSVWTTFFGCIGVLCDVEWGVAVGSGEGKREGAAAGTLFIIVGEIVFIVEDVKTKKMVGRAPTSVRKAILFSGC